ncbi:MAG: DUF2889 domain-containing protein [Bacillota bacterium]
MKALFNRQWLCAVKKLPEGVRAQTHYLDTKREMSVQMLVDPHTFAIREAIVETYRAPGGREFCKSREIPELVGVVAYFEAGRDLRKIAWENELEQNLFAENIRAVIQAETYLIKERGYASAKDYDDYWREMYRNTCRYYSNLEKVKKTWLEHIADQERFSNLYCRCHSYTLYSPERSPENHSSGNPSGGFVLTGTFHDSFHELSLVLKLNGGGSVIAGARAQMLRGPDDVCKEGMTEAVHLIGKPLAPAPGKKEIAALLGGQNGCVHLIDLAYNLGQTLKYYQEKAQS